MARNTLEGITYQHVLYGAGTILSGKSDIRSALIQPEDLEAAIAYAMPLLESPEFHHGAGEHDHGVGDQSDPHEYGSEEASSDLRQILSLYNATVIDGRYIEDLPTDPKSVAARLDMELSDSAASAIEEARSTIARRFGASAEALRGRGKKIVAVAIVVVIAIRAEERPYEIVIDSSGVVKV